MSKKKTSRIGKAEQSIQDLIYFSAGLKSRLESIESSIGEYISFNDDWEKFNKFVEEKQKMFEKNKK